MSSLIRKVWYVVWPWKIHHSNDVYTVDEVVIYLKQLCEAKSTEDAVESILQSFEERSLHEETVHRFSKWYADYKNEHNEVGYAVATVWMCIVRHMAERVFVD